MKRNADNLSRLHILFTFATTLKYFPYMSHKIFITPWRINTRQTINFPIKKTLFKASQFMHITPGRMRHINIF